jgi:hypothetical protein
VHPDQHVVAANNRLVHLNDPNHFRRAIPGIHRGLHRWNVSTARKTIFLRGHTHIGEAVRSAGCLSTQRTPRRPRRYGTSPSSGRFRAAGLTPPSATLARRVCSALLARFPALEDSDVDTAVWTVTPKQTDRVVRLSIAAAHDADVVPAVREMAKDFGLICYDPRRHAVWPNIPGYEPAISLWSMAGLGVPDPNSDRIHGAVKHLTHPYLGA